MNKKIAQEIIDGIVEKATVNDDTLPTGLTVGDKLIGTHYHNGKLDSITIDTFLRGIITLNIDPDGKISEAFVEKYSESCKDASEF